MKLKSCILLLWSFVISAATAAEWQWSVPVENSRAFLWIPPNCRQVRAVLFGQNNMIEQGILEHTILRQELSKLGIAEIFIAPPFENWQNATNNEAANQKFYALLETLAGNSGYDELRFAPVIPLGHSAMASFPWNFAAWNPQRTLAVLSIHGDAPQTGMTGNGRPNADWGHRNIDGIPGLMVMGEYEWWDDRLEPALKFHHDHPRTPLALLAEPGNGHFNYCDDLVKFLALFIRKAAEVRLPAHESTNHPPLLKLVDPTNEWLVQRWHLGQKRTVMPAPFAKYTGDRNQALWAFDQEMARATENYFADQPGKLPQLIGFVQDGKIVPQTESLQQVSLNFEPDADGVTFYVSATFLGSVQRGSKNLSRWTGLPVGSPLGHASGGGPIVFSTISGPVHQLNADTFRVEYNRLNSTTDWRNSAMWILASHPGDKKFKRAVQQARIQIPEFRDGAEQHIVFPKIPDQKISTKELKLSAASDSGRPVYYYVVAGPAEVHGNKLKFSPIPPRAKYPIAVTVVAWQLGKAGQPQLRTALSIERTFNLQN